MSRIILIEKSSSLRKLLSINLQLYTDSEVITKRNGDDAIDFLKEEKDIQLIISEDMVGDENTILKVYYFVNSQKLNIPIILMGQNAKLVNSVKMLEKENWRKIIKTAAELVGVTAESMVENEVPDYIPISLPSFLGIDKTNVNIFHENNGEYEIIFKRGQGVDAKIVKDFLVNNVPHLFVYKDQRLEFAESFSTQMVEYLKKSDISVSDRIAATGAAFNSVQKELQLSGISEHGIKMAKSAVESMITLAASDSKLVDLLNMIQESDASYLYRHSLLVSTVAHHLIGKMEWGSKEQQNKISFVSFFHDITIPDDSLCRIQSNKELEEAELGPEDKKRVKNHALNACEMLKDIPGTPFGAEAIILQHHGSKTGIGFPTNLDPQISPLAIVFRVAEDYCDILLHLDKEGFIREKVFKMLKKKYEKGVYRKAVLALEESTQSN